MAGPGLQDQPCPVPVEAPQLSEADAAGLMLADQRGELQLLASSSDEARTMELSELQHDQRPCVDAYRSGLPVTNVDQVEVETRWPAFTAQVKAGTLSSAHALPMRLRRQTIGGLNLFLTRPGHLSDADLELAQGLADIATIRLLQERVPHEQQLLAEQLQGAMNSRVVIQQPEGMLAAQHSLAISDAFRVMRSHARRSGRTLTQVAVDISDGATDFLQPPAESD